ncbi:MAG: indolepyruvate ferredoxin oxidoreductase family protein [Burkholderiaceae bacterium]
MALHAVSLDDKYARLDGRIHITGSQALVRLAMLQSIRDSAAGLNTACYISGYRGSPMHNLDKELWRARRFLEKPNIHFWPAVNEDLAATAIWGTQQANAFGDATVDGIYAMWYGKGPGLDRSMDAIRHGNMAGTSQHGGVLAVVGDDHALTSTDAPAAHEYAFVEMMMPVLYPAGVSDIIEYGLLGWAMSRYCGAWVGFKVIPDSVDASISLDADPNRLKIVLPTNFDLPADGVNLRIPDFWYQQEPRHREYKLGAALAFARANQMNRVMVSSPRPRYGIIATGKAYTDTRQAMLEMGITDAVAADIGLTVLKLAMPYPFDIDGIRDFASGLEEVFVVEEKLRMTETNVRDALYSLPDSQRPRVIGRDDENGKVLLPQWPEITPEDVTKALAQRIEHFHNTEQIRQRLGFIDAVTKQKTGRPALSVVRQPYFCSGCPHNSGTKVPEGSRAHGGVGCHFMATYMDRNNVTHSHMGGEGLTWVGQSAFVKTEHVFQNMGDGTYFHSGLLAIRGCVAAAANITFKVLFNDAVAMTGGQPIDGHLTPAMITSQVHAEGIRKIFVVTDDPQKYEGNGETFAPGTVIKHRSEMDAVQRECREYKGVSLLVFDQTCAAEKRRRRKSGKLEDPGKRLFINDRVCEGCGDCGVKSNCMSVTPVETLFGRKRAIDQSACNKDYSCQNGFCPSFVSVIGGKPKKSASSAPVPSHLTVLPEPDRPQLNPGEPFSILVTGVGGTGVVTIGALLTMAAHMEGKHFSTVDQFGMAQKGGAVTSHIRLAHSPADIHAVRLNAGAADLVLGCDSLVTGADVSLATMARGKTRVILNTHQQITGHFTRNPKLQFPVVEIDNRLSGAINDDQIDNVNASQIATRLLGDSIASNLFMLGYAYQKGLIPVSAPAIDAAIELNGVAVEMNRNAFLWGRRAARDLKAVVALTRSDAQVAEEAADTITGRIETFASELEAYQSGSYANTFRKTVDAVRQAEQSVNSASEALTDAVARNLFKLMAYKDEYEVARLYTDGRFEKKLAESFDGDFALKFHLAPPLLARRDKQTGELQKKEFGAWILGAMRWLARGRRLRGTALDPFGYTAERRAERGLLRQYQETLSTVIAGLTADNLALAVELAGLPEDVRGYGHVKEAAMTEYNNARNALMERWNAPGTPLRRVA